MFKKLKSYFQKKDEDKESNLLAGITVYSEKGGEIYFDLAMTDDSDECVKSVAKMLAMYNLDSFLEVCGVLKKQLEDAEKEDLYVEIIEEVSGILSVSYSTEEDLSDEPCINPSDMI
jgi:hypothetical protein